MFDVERLTAFCTEAIRAFAAEHPDETFYGFAIDARLLCLNSVERFEATRADEEEDAGGPLDAAEVEELRRNTGDWAYQGFARMTPEHGFDEDAYREHYDLPDDRQPTSAYAVAMDDLVRRLTAGGAFDCLRRTPDFFATRVEHDY